MNLRGKKINVLGDSITEGAGVSLPENRFCDRLKFFFGAAEVRNYGIGGTRIAPQRTPSAYPRHDLDFISRVPEMDPDADLVLVFGGTNDFGHGDAPLGTAADTAPDTFYGALSVLMTLLIEKYPGRPIVFLTPLHRQGEAIPKTISSAGGFESGSGPILEDYVDAIRTVARRFSLPVLDLWATSGISPQVPVIRKRFIPDGLHPNDDGHAILADRIVGFLNSL